MQKYILVKWIDLVQKFTFPCFKELLLYLYHFFVVFWENPLFQTEYKFFDTKWEKYQTFPFVLQIYLIFICYKVTRKLSFLIFKFELFYTGFFKGATKSQWKIIFLPQNKWKHIQHFKLPFLKLNLHFDTWSKYLHVGN